MFWYLSKESKLFNSIFNSKEIKIIKKQLKNLKLKQIVYCSFENRFAKSGGLGAVTQAILPYLDSYKNKTRAILITPFYTNIIKDKNIKKSNLKFKVPFNNRNIDAEILEFQVEYNIPQKGVLKEYYIKAKGFFESKNSLNDPYIYTQDDLKTNNEKLILNALFFCKAVPYLLEKIKLTENIVFHLQDWQTGLITLTSKEALLNNILKSCSSTLTMHNYFDSFIGEKFLKKTTNRIPLLKELTALQIAVQLVDTPVITVSRSFSKEFTNDIIQKEHFAPHLQNILMNNKIRGINNGMFIDFPDEYKNSSKINIDDIKKLKHEARRKMLKIINDYTKSEYIGELNYKGKSIINLPIDIPIFIMTGRLDFSQKGYDVFLQAIKKFSKDQVKAILTPKAVVESDLIFFKKIAEECKGNVIVFFKNITYGFSELQTGSTFGVMPSIYEPFGAAIEYMVKGTVVIARKTGGLMDQIDKNCGMLYREKNNNYTLENIRSFSYLYNNVKEKMNNNWVKDMIDALYNTLNHAKYIYQQDNERYYKMIKNGFKKAKKFSWQKSVKEYFKVYKKKN